MALIDVSELLLDPDLVDEAVVRRDTIGIGPDGVSTVVASRTYKILAALQPGSGDMLKLLPEGTRVEGTMQIFTTFRLQQATATTPADIIIWQGQEFVVQLLNAFGNFGAGYYSATLTVKPLLS